MYSRRKISALSRNCAWWSLRPRLVLGVLILCHSDARLQDREIRWNSNSVFSKWNERWKRSPLKTRREGGWHWWDHHPGSENSDSHGWGGLALTLGTPLEVPLAPVVLEPALRKKAGCRFLMSLFWCQWGMSLTRDLLLLLHCLVSAVLGGMLLLTIWRGTLLLFLFRAIMWIGMKYRMPISLNLSVLRICTLKGILKLLGDSLQEPGLLSYTIHTDSPPHFFFFFIELVTQSY